MENILNQVKMTIENGQGYIDSREMATMFEKQHKHILRSIKEEVRFLENYTKPKSGLSEMFIESSYKDTTGRTLIKYKLNKDGFYQIAMSFKSKKSKALRYEFIKAFNKLEQDYNELLQYALKKDSMLMKHKDKIEFTVNELYPLLRRNGVYENEIYKVHELIKKKLIGKYEMITKADNFIKEDFKKDYELEILGMKKVYTKYFTDSNQFRFNFEKNTIEC